MTKIITSDLNQRLEGLDIFRGLCVFGMILVAYAGDWTHRFQVLEHARWYGWSMADLIFPGFLFCVGASIPFAIDSRMVRQSTGSIAQHILVRSFLLVALGVVLNFLASPNIFQFRVPGILQRIGLCYAAAAGFFLAIRSHQRRTPTALLTITTITTLAILVVYAMLLLLWNTGSCPSACFDSVNALPAVVDRFVFSVRYLWPWGLTNNTVTYDPEGLVSTLGAAANVLIGISATLFYRSRSLGDSRNGRLIWLVLVGVALILIGLVLDTWIPLVKKIWTPSFAIFSGGTSLCVFAVLCFVADKAASKNWGLLFKIYGANATLAFVAVSLLDIVLQLPIVGQSTHDRAAAWLVSALPGARVGSLTYSVVVLLLIGTLLYHAYKRRLFLRL